MAATWLITVAWFYLGVCFVCAAVITYDIFFNRRRQPMGVMDAVYPITALYLGPFALVLYWRWARSAVRPMAMATAERGDGYAHDDSVDAVGSGAGHEPGHALEPAKPRWVTMAIEVSHCGSDAHWVT